MILTKLARGILTMFGVFVLVAVASAQTKTITGKVTDPKGEAVPSATVTVKGTKTSTSTGNDGTFRLAVPSNATTLVITSVGYTSTEVSISGDVVNATLEVANEALNEVVVIGYGTQRKRDLTGAVASVKAKDFNQGVQIAPDQLIQGKVAGVQVINNSGQPGGATTFKIRGNSSLRSGNQPLFVIDGVIVDGSSARPGLSVTGLGNAPDANPLNFINPNDIASIDVLKDASATAIYGSRGANGVVIVTTKKGQSGTPKVELNASYGVSSILRRIEVLNATEYRQSLQDYSLTGGNFNADVDAYDAILTTANTLNSSLAVSGGSESARYRISVGYLDQDGIIKNTGFKKLTAGINSNFKFLKNKRAGFDFNLLASQQNERIGAISNNAGFTGNVLSTALQWNPTRPLRKPDGSINNYFDGSTLNPLEFIEGFRDNAVTTNIVGSFSPSYKFTDNLEYKLLYGFNYGTGERRTSIRRWVNLENNGINNDWPNGQGTAAIGNNQLLTQTVTQTLTYNKKIGRQLNFNGLLGYEYFRKENKGVNLIGRNFASNSTASDPLDYTDILEYSLNTNKRFFSFNNPVEEIRSFFTRLNFDYKSKYYLTATFRADGSSKFGSNNRYGFFPSFSAGWNLSDEEFFKVDFINSLKLRGGWGITGNQEFPAGAALIRNVLNENSQGTPQVQLFNKNLKWQEDVQSNIGIDFTMLNRKLSGTIDLFSRTTKQLLYPNIAPQPSPGTVKWENLNGQIENKGIEITLNAAIVSKQDFNWDLGVNATFVKNEVSGLPAPIQTGELNGQGMSGTLSQLITNGQPINTFYTRDFRGIDKATGQSIYVDDGNVFYLMGNPNPTTILGISTTISYKNLSLSANLNGAFGHVIYNNTANSVLPIGNLGTRNIAKALYKNGESTTNPITSSSRYLEKGNYLKAANTTLSYKFGSVGKEISGISVYVTAQNLFLLTKYTGFDPEVNTDKQVNGIPSVGIDYIGYPSARTFLFGVNVSF
ncbi:SusC/RagA family TonB-linked outer membrane protein [Lacibacter sp.]|uniref:SusC/RagA family TonB-linked outer membrane protein n=1 Tax=Lacibacter sp. TaxID=1915409 RepID=UPI002B4AF51F|nr:SusC/RagA family TonB-linked outer membrane protein [Lacibacter sp.]HLP36945.1 SusC/RagA family TonB-linked outer membrane protein [Lacibacter sp.]